MYGMLGTDPLQGPTMGAGASRDKLPERRQRLTGHPLTTIMRKETDMTFTFRRDVSNQRETIRHLIESCGITYGISFPSPYMVRVDLPEGVSIGQIAMIERRLNENGYL
jgi:hypothetical protein